jgi:signal peptidase I
MYSELFEGDVILVSKLNYGARLLISEKRSRSMRIPLFEKVKHNDIIVFNFPKGDIVYANAPEINYYDNKKRKAGDQALADTIEYARLLYVPVQYRQPYVRQYFNN